MLTQDEQERERYESRLNALRDLYSITDAARDEGREQGLEQGLQQGLQRGLLQGLQQGLQQGLRQGVQQGVQQGLERGETVGRIHVCQRLLKLPLTPREELLDLPVVELHARAAALEQQLGDLGQ